MDRRQGGCGVVKEGCAMVFVVVEAKLALKLRFASDSGVNLVRSRPSSVRSV